MKGMNTEIYTGWRGPSWTLYLSTYVADNLRANVDTRVLVHRRRIIMVKRVRKHPSLPPDIPARVQMYVPLLDVWRPANTYTNIHTYVCEWVGACVRAWARVFTSRIYPRLWVVTGRSRNVNTAAVTDRTPGPPIRLDRLQTFPTTRGNRTPTIALPACLPALFPALFSFEQRRWETLLMYGLFLNVFTGSIIRMSVSIKEIRRCRDCLVGKII